MSQSIDEIKRHRNPDSNAYGEGAGEYIDFLKIIIMNATAVLENMLATTAFNKGVLDVGLNKLAFNVGKFTRN